MIPWLLITLTAAAAVVAPDQVCLHDVTHVSPSLEGITHIGPSVDTAHASPTLDVSHEDC